MGPELYLSELWISQALFVFFGWDNLDLLGLVRDARAEGFVLLKTEISSMTVVVTRPCTLW
jgi:hypothetical protein